MALVFFFYGLAFFVLGLTILVYPKKQSAFALARHLNLLAGFGLTHGANEWLDLFILIKVPDPSHWLEITRMVTLPVSFVFLVQFGVRTIIERTGRWRPLAALPALLVAAWMGVFLLSADHMRMGDIWARYLICLPGTLLTAYGLWLYHATLRDPELAPAVRSLQCAAVTFAVYGIAAGAIVKAAGFWPATMFNYDVFRDVFGIPVQIVRTACAATLACCTLHMMRIFHWETQNRLYQSELRVRTVAEAAPVILFMEDRDGRIIFAQGKALERLRMTGADLLGQPVSALFAELSKSDPRRRCLSDNGSCNCRLTAAGATFDVRYATLRDASGEVSGAIGIALDVTDRLESERQLHEYRSEMGRMRRLTELGTMSTAMAERISRPLNVTQLLLERLLGQLNGQDPHADGAPSLKKALAELTEAMAILERFCDAARISPLEKARPVDLYQLGRKVASAFLDRAAAMDLEIDLDGLDCVVDLFVAERELEYIFFVMVQQALDKARPDRHEHLAIRCATEDNHIVLDFSDTCETPGIEQLSQVFEPFAMSNGADTGTDLGLAVIKQVVETHAGAIEARAGHDRGVTFRITLPIQR